MPKFIVNKKRSLAQKLSSQKTLNSTLLPTEKIIKIARRFGVDFGSGNPNERIRYFIKLGLLPYASRKSTKKNGQILSPIGHLPEWTIDRLKNIQELKSQGYSFPQIAQIVKTNSEKPRVSKQNPQNELPRLDSDVLRRLPSESTYLNASSTNLHPQSSQFKEEIYKPIEDSHDGSKNSNDLSQNQENNFSKPPNYDYHTPEDLDEYSKSRLLPTKRVIEITQNLGVNWGMGNPLERIRYFIKLGILPHAIRKSTSIEELGHEFNAGHLPAWAIKRLIFVNNLSKKGYSFPQIAKKIKKIEQNKLEHNESNNTKIDQKQSTSGPAQRVALFSKTGLSEKDVSKRLKLHERNIIRFIDRKLSSLPTYLTLDANLLEPEKNHNLTLAIKSIVLIVPLSTLLILGIFASKNSLNDLIKSKLSKGEVTTSPNLLGQVLSATSDEHRLYIDADTEVSGLTTFAQNITAPNVLYGAVGGTAITVSAGQRPTISLDTTAIVPSVNTISGALTISGSGGTTISASGSTITITTTSSPLTAEADTLSTVTGRGATTSTALTLNGAVTLGNTLSFSTTNSTVNITNAGSLAFKDGTNTLFSVIDQGSYGTLRLTDKGSTSDPSSCSAGDIYFNATDTTVKACTATNTWEALDGGG